MCIRDSVSGLVWHKRLTPDAIGGLGDLEFQTHSHYRPSEEELADSNLDGISDGRDLQRLSFRAAWQRNFQMENGILTTVQTAAAANAFMVQQDRRCRSRPDVYKRQARSTSG